MVTNPPLKKCSSSDMNLVTPLKLKPLKKWFTQNGEFGITAIPNPFEAILPVKISSSSFFTSFFSTILLIFCQLPNAICSIISQKAKKKQSRHCTAFVIRCRYSDSLLVFQVGTDTGPQYDDRGAGMSQT